MQDDIKFEGVKHTKKSAIKHFWTYCAILFSISLLLVMIAGYVQTKTFNDLVSENQAQESILNTNQSMIQNVQNLNEELREDLEKLQKEHEILTKENDQDKALLSKAQIDNNTLLMLANVEKLFINNAKAQAKTEFLLINPDVITSEEVMNLYLFIKQKLGIK